LKASKILLILLVLIGCKKIEDNYTIFTIKKNHHRSTYSYNTSRDTIFNWDIIFDSSAIYTTQDPNNQYDINKLIGWSDCSENHLKYSIRFGWRWINDNLEIHWFRHQHDQFEFGKIKSVELGKTYNYILEIKDNEYILCVDDTCVKLDRTCSQEYRKYKLYPYFGGDEKSPHDIKIRIK
tara:strand:+ start:2305 stop:2844 length:540 start_codon:yes stop_codon:yes gene_type:complete